MQSKILVILAVILITGCNPELSVNGPGITFNANVQPSQLAELNGTDPTYTQTTYPIVLVHGLYGFKDIFGMDYFWLVPEALEIGGAEVYIATVSGLESSENRGEQLLVKVQEILAISGASKVNLIGHSHGGPTSRYVASVRPDLVASVSTAHGVNHRGSNSAELIAEAIRNGGTGFVLQGMFNALGALIDYVAQDFHPQSAVKSFHSMNFLGVDEFNADHPQALPAVFCDEGAYTVNGVNYYSWGGIGIKTNKFDPLDWLIAASGDTFEGEENDGMVSKCGQHLGQVIRDDYDHNHLDAMNWTVGFRREGSTNPLTIYRTQANRLKNAGF